MYVGFQVQLSDRKDSLTSLRMSSFPARHPVFAFFEKNFEPMDLSESLSDFSEISTRREQIDRVL